MPKSDKKSSKLKLPLLRGEGWVHSEIDPTTNASALHAADGLAETAYLLAEPANAAHLRKSIKQYRRVNRSTTSIE
ncbi:MAG: hypothetical protein ABL985_05135 [Casimicrobium sp.]